jgi:hypothetical protein
MLSTSANSQQSVHHSVFWLENQASRGERQQEGKEQRVDKST